MAISFWRLMEVGNTKEEKLLGIITIRLVMYYHIAVRENGNGKQYVTDDNGRIDILAISKDKKELLVVELKKGRASDIVVGQVQRYMGYVKEVIAEENQIVKGIIIALEVDLKLKRALSV